MIIYVELIITKHLVVVSFKNFNQDCLSLSTSLGAISRGLFACQSARVTEVIPLKQAQRLGCIRVSQWPYER